MAFKIPLHYHEANIQSFYIDRNKDKDDYPYLIRSNLNRRVVAKTNGVLTIYKEMQYGFSIPECLEIISLVSLVLKLA